MNYVWNYVLTSWLFVKFLVLSLVHAQLEYTSVVDINRGISSLQCPGDAFIKILNISVKNEEYCESKPCIIDDGDHEVLRRLCENSTNCLIYGSNLSSECLLEYRRFNLSYYCEAPISLQCNFENDMVCNLEQETDDDFDWTINSAGTPSPGTGPDSDHTTNSSRGFYMYIEASSEEKKKKARLISKPIVCKYAQCLTFWYHMYGNHIGSLSIYQKPAGNVWKRNGLNDDQWKQAKMDLYCHGPFQIVIEGKIRNQKDSWQGDIALDDVFVFGGSCEKTGKTTCNFEQKQSCTLHNTPDMSDDPEYISWNVVQGKSTTYGPTTDHTIKSEDGFFFHLEAFESPGKGRLESDSILFIGPNCLTIWYYIIGNTTNKLTLYTMSGVEIRNIMTIHGHSEEKWKKMAVSVDIIDYDKIVIDGSLKQRGSISFDDISISEGVCIEDEEYNDSCLSINRQYKIEECATLYFQREGLNIALYPSFTNSNKACTDQKNEIEWKLNQFCVDNYLYSNCRFNLESLIWDYNECFTFKKRILITYLCTDMKTTTVSSDSTSGDSSAGLVVGLIIGGLLLACAVIFIVVLFRRHTLKSRPREKLRNNLGGNDYIGSQDIVLPQTSNHSSHMQNDGMYDQLESRNTSFLGYESTQINNVQQKYTSVGAANGFVNKDGVQTPTYAVRRDKTFADNHMPNDDEYAIVDPTAETSFNETKDNRTGTADSYMVLDPTETGFNRQIFSNTPVGYEFAKPVKDTEKKICDEDQYDISDERVYDHSGSNRHKESEDNIYNHAVDTIYDSGSHKRNNEGREDTYDHFFGQTTEDDYNVSKTT